MVNVELAHNPYLRETRVRFNGREPRVNSAIEKHAGKKLVDWVDEVPSILRDEMNGYGFELVFSGTDADFDSLATVFSTAGIGEDQVRLVHKATLGGVREKQTGVRKLLAWLETRQNRKFDYIGFLDENPALAERSLPLIVLHGAESSAPEDLSIEEIDSIEDLDNTDLTCTPIVYHLDRASSLALKKDIAWLLSRKDVGSKQLFFVVHSGVQKKSVLRTLSDLGVENPRAIDGACDEAVAGYAESYPLTEYVCCAIKSFDRCVERIGSELEEENEEGARSSVGGRAKIAKIEDEISRIKKAQEHFAHLDSLEEPRGFWEANARLKDSLLGWKSKKTKITGEQEVASWAEDFEAFARRKYDTCLDEIRNVVSETMGLIGKSHAAAYEAAEVDLGYKPAADSIAASVLGTVLNLKRTMLNLVTVSYEEPRNDFFGIFASSEPDENGLIKVTSCYLDQWREAAADLLVLMAKEAETEAMESLRCRYKLLARDYAEHLASLVEQRKEAKEKLTSRLSEEEKALQEDNDWLSEFKEQLQEIKRG